MTKSPIQKFTSRINFEKFLIIYILLQPFIDVATSLCVRFINSYFTIGIFIRTLFLLCTLVYSFNISNKKWKRILLIYCIVLFIYFILFFLNICFNIGFFMIITQLKSLIKIFYFSILLVALIPIMKKIHFDNKHLVLTLLEYTSILCISLFLGIAFDSYANGSGYGKNGLFYAANEIGTTLCILTSFLFLNLSNFNFKNFNKNFIIDLITLIFIIISALWMGTKVPFIGLILSLLVSFGICIINIIKRKNIKEYLYKIGGIIFVFFIIFNIISYSPVGKNLGISINRISNISKTNNNNKTSDSSASKNQNVETVILSSRDIYYDNTLKEYKSSSTISKLLGIGFVSNENGLLSEKKSIEIDYFDILFSTGIIGFIVFFLPLIIILIYIFKLFWSKKCLIFENHIIFYLYSIFISLIIARLSGHVFTTPAVSFYLALIINKLICILKSKEE